MRKIRLSIPILLIGAWIYAQVGIGTNTPENTLDIVQSNSSLRLKSNDVVGVNGQAKMIISGRRGDTTADMSIIEFQVSGNDGAKISSRTPISNSKVDGAHLVFSTASSASSSMTDRMTIQNTGNVGIGISQPSTTLDVNGDLRIRSLPTETNTANFSTMVADTNGNIKSIAKSGSTSLSGITPGGSGTATLNSTSGSIVIVRSLDACGRDMISTFTVARDALLFLNGQVQSTQQVSTRQSSGRSNVITAASIGNCADGTDGVWDYTLTVNSAGTQLTLTNNNANNRNYTITTTQL
ncbi:hypothetical protein UJ101_02569 [Flavobacteriaceae bacterium UJ101]|nr:hypothetical protein UJ101_02569 [Flavobacteriaceae bacterium UJ101]